MNANSDYSKWKKYRLKAVVPSIKNGQWGDDPKNDHLDQFVLRVADFNEFTFNLKKDLTVRNIKNKQLNLSEGDLVIEKSGGGEKQLVGRVVQLKGSNKNDKYSYSNFVGKLLINNRYVTNDFLKYSFRNIYFTRRNYCYIKQTTGIQNLDTSALISEEFLQIPDKSTQNNISKFLDNHIETINEKIKKNKKLIKLLEEKREATINQAVTKGLDPKVKLKDSGIEWIGEIPEHWEAQKLKFSTTQSTVKSNSLKEIPYVGLEHVISQKGKIESNGTSDDVDGDTLSFSKGDVLLGKLRPYLAKVFEAEFDGCSSSEFIVYKQNKYQPTFLKYLLLSRDFTFYINSITYGVKMPRANPDEINNLVFPLPSIKEQDLITSYVDDESSLIDKKISQIIEKIKLLEEYKQSLIHHAVTGKIDVRKYKPKYAN